jgi:hypothetical protein
MKNETTFSLSSALLLGLVLLIAGPGMANELLEKDFPGGSPLIIPAAAFNNTGLNPTSSTFNTNGFIGGGGSFTCFVAPAYLPDGAEVTRLTAVLVDMSSTNMTVSLIRTDNTGYRLTSGMASVTTNGDTYPNALANTYSTTSIGNATVQYPDYSYYVSACVPSWEFQLHQVELRYTESLIFRDGFESDNLEAWSFPAAKVGVMSPEPESEFVGYLDRVAATVPEGTAKSIPFSSPLEIAASEFKPEGYQAGQLLTSFVDGVLYGANYDGSRYAHAPIYLPDGATITDIMSRVVDNDAGGGGASNCASGSTSDIELTIVRKKGCSGSTCYDTMATASSSGANAAIQFLEPAAIDYPVVDGSEYGYFAVVRLCGPKHKIYNLRVSYTLP